ncbi:MAG: PSD1 domain-containing protein [Cyclobacteriaceae bacterium]
MPSPKNYIGSIISWFAGLVYLCTITLSGCTTPQNDFSQKLPEVVDFNFHIKPILSDRCFACHGPDDKARKAELRLDIQESAFAVLDSIKDHHVLKPGELDKSELYRRISSEEARQVMPPPESNMNLSPFEVALIKRWIEQGAEWKPHWSFMVPEKNKLPKVEMAEWSQNEIDYFVLDKLERLDWRPSSSASKEKLLRRLSFDLTGLSPDIEQIEAFVADDSDIAYEKMVDKYLASSTFGERLATEWIDLARYAETNGIHHDFERNMWPWRDWVIKSFNDNMAYDQFVTWQLAGDLFPEPTYDQLLATAFNRNHRTTQECGSIDEEFRVSYVIDRTNTFGKAFMGLTIECAQCHDHKYDPISQKEYYQLSAFFNQVPEEGVSESFKGQPEPYLELPEAEVQKIRNYIDEQVEVEYTDGSSQDRDKKYLSNWKEEMEALLQPVMIMKDQDTLRPTYILERGLYDGHGEEVTFGTPESVSLFDSTFAQNRLGLAKWLFSKDNPLTARVAINRYWQMIFGRGLVDTPDDFGNQGSIPSHPELLDWLAVDFMESGWDVKQLLKTMVMSATYQQASKTDGASLEFDPENRWLARGVQQRLTAEMLRDQALKISGLLNEKIGGPSVKPYQPDSLWVQVSSGGRYTRKYMVAHGEDLYRRSMYTYWKRVQPPPAMMIFDAASRNQCTVKRQSTNTPLQALVLLNDPQFIEASRALANRMMIEGGANADQRIENAFRWTTSRKPEADELNTLSDLYHSEVQEFQKYPERAEEFLQIGEYKNNDNLNKLELAAYGVVANAIINLSESLQKN